MGLFSVDLVTEIFLLYLNLKLFENLLRERKAKNMFYFHDQFLLLLEISLSVWSLPSMIHPRNEGLRISVPPISSSTCFFRYFLFAPWFYFVDINSMGEAAKNSWQNIFTLWWLGTTITGKWIERFVSGRLSIPPFIYMESHVFMAWQTDYYQRKNLTK